MDSAGDEMDDEVSEEDDGDGGLDMASILLLFLMSSGFGFLCFGIGEIKVHFGGMAFHRNFRDKQKPGSSTITTRDNSSYEGDVVPSGFEIHLSLLPEEQRWNDQL